MNYESSNTCFPLHSQPIRPRQPGHGKLDRRDVAVHRAADASSTPSTSASTVLSSNTPGGWMNSTVALINVSVLQCPSRTGTRGSTPSSPRTGQFYGMGNYVGNYGGPGPISLMSGTIIPSNNNYIGSAPLPCATAAGPNVLRSGPSWGPVRIASITDGTSNTGLLSERLLGIPSPYPGFDHGLGPGELQSLLGSQHHDCSGAERGTRQHIDNVSVLH